MKCRYPFMRDPSGKIRWSTKMTKEEKVDCIPFPCGICLHCKINKRRVWTHRILLEQRMHDDSCFVTLTYNEKNIPKNRQLEKTDLQKYIKRLRYKTRKFRYYAVGEYGDKNWRPHYHLALFNLGQIDSQDIISSWKKNTEKDCPTVVGDLNKDSACYIAGYVMKKLTNKKDKRLNGLSPEFMISSRGTKKEPGGIGYPYVKDLAERLNKFKYKQDEVTNQLYHKGRPLPLGGYLTRTLSTLTKISEKALNQKFDEYLETIYSNHINPEDSYWIKQFEDDERMLQSEKKHQIFKKGRTL